MAKSIELALSVFRVEGQCEVLPGLTLLESLVGSLPHHERLEVELV